MGIEEIIKDKSKEFCITKAEYLVAKYKFDMDNTSIAVSNSNKLGEYLNMGCNKCDGFNKECDWYFPKSEYDRIPF